MTDRIKELIEEGNQLFTKRGQLLNLWQTIAENFYPERADFTRTRYVGEEFAANLMSSYPLIVRRELGNAFSAMLRPRDQPWFEITVEDDDDLDATSREWLEWASGVQRRAMYDRLSQFVRATKEGDHDFAAFGQCVISQEIDSRKEIGPHLLYRCWHLKDVVWCEKYDGTIGEIHRRWKPTISQMKRYFRNVNRRIQDAKDKDNYREVECRHIVRPADEYESSTGKKWRTPWVSIHLDVENEHVMEEVGVWSPIYTIPRWQTVAGSQYAYSPASVAGLPDARLIQAMTLTLLEAGEMAVRPPMLATKEAIRSDVAIYAGGITWADAEYDERLGEVLRPVYQEKSGLPFGMDLDRDKRETLASCFYLNKLGLPTPEREMTAYETGQRIQEYIRQALPLFEPMELEYNGALCEDTFDSLMRGGAFGPAESIPEGIRGRQVRFKFESPLHQAIERQKGAKLQEASQLLADIVKVDPNTATVVDWAKAYRDAVQGIGAPAKWVRSEDEIEAIAAQAAQEQQAQQAMATVGQGAEVAQQVGNAQQALNAA